MSGVGSGAWATADLNPVRRLQVIAGAAKNPMYAERYFDAPVDEVWGVAADLERELPHLVRGIRSFTFTTPQRERSSAVAVSSIGHRERFEVVMRPGWCLMQSRLIVGGMAATAEGDGTRFALLGRLRFPGGPALQGMRWFGTEARSQTILDRLQQRLATRGDGPWGD